MISREQFDTLVDKFFADRRETDSGWAEVTQEDKVGLDMILFNLIDLKFGKDADGALPIEIRYIDRNTHQRMHYFAIPYPHKSTTKEIARAAQSACVNLSLAQGEVDMLVRLLVEEMEEGTDE